MGLLLLSPRTLRQRFLPPIPLTALRMSLLLHLPLRFQLRETIGPLFSAQLRGLSRPRLLQRPRRRRFTRPASSLSESVGGLTLWLLLCAFVWTWLISFTYSADALPDAAARSRLVSVVISVTPGAGHIVVIDLPLPVGREPRLTIRVAPALSPVGLVCL